MGRCNMSLNGKYRRIPVVIVNDKYELQIEYPDWYNNNEAAVKTYKMGRLPNGKIGVKASNNYAYFGEHDTCVSAALSVVYEDENLFGSAGLLHMGHYRVIKLKGFAEAVEKHNYHKKWDDMAASGWFEATEEERESAYERQHSNMLERWGLDPKDVNVIAY